MTPPAENQGQPEVDETVGKAHHVFESTKTYLESTVAEARVIENKTRYLLVLTLSVSFGLVGFLAVIVGNKPSSDFLLDLAWVSGALLLVLAIVSFVLMWNLLPQHKVHHPGNEFRNFAGSGIILKAFWQMLLTESRAYQDRIDANVELNKRRGNRLKWSTYAVIVSLVAALGGFLVFSKGFWMS